MQLEVRRQPALLAEPLERGEQFAFGDAGQYMLAGEREAIEDGADAGMNRYESVVLVFGRALRTAAADVEHAELATVQQCVDRLQLDQLPDPHAGEGEDGEGGVLRAGGGIQELF